MTVPVVAIDGPAGSGKSTTARALARGLGLSHLDSGSLYRTLALVGLESHTLDPGPLMEEAVRLAVHLVPAADGFAPLRAGEDVSSRIRSAEVTKASSRIAGIPEIRDWVNRRLRATVQECSRAVVVDGRDIGTVVFPDATVKIFLTASLRVRAIRRLAERGMDEPDPAEIQTEIERIGARDAADSTREVAPLRKPDGAVEVDTSDLTFEQQVEKVAGIVSEKLRQVDR